MVSPRCKIFVQSVLEKHGLHWITIELGQVEIEENISISQWEELNESLKKSGIELMKDKKSILIEQIKKVTIELVHSSEPLSINFSDHLSRKLNYDYSYLATLFSGAEGMTIEHFHILHKIERIKELMIYDGLSVSDIAFKMHYSSVAHLANQFKKTTGLTTSYFKKIRQKSLQF